MRVFASADPSVYARHPQVHQDESCADGLDRPEPIRSLQALRPSRPITRQMTFLPGTDALSASEDAMRWGARTSRGLAHHASHAPSDVEIDTLES